MNKNLTNTSSPSPFRRGQGEVVSYTKTQKLITALYMVTDIMDTEEPLRNKLRTLGLKILSDPSTSLRADTSITRIEQILSFLNIAITMNFISEMNGNILIKEFTSLKASLSEHADVKPSWLEEFLKDPSPTLPEGEGGIPLPTPLLASRGGKFNPPSPKGYSSRGELNSKGHIGVQKAGTLMKAIKDISMSDRNHFNILKQERRSEIIRAVKAIPGGATISDIKTNTSAQGLVLHNVSEKTLQRELMSMTKDGVLNKTGEKRWSRYFVAQALGS